MHITFSPSRRDARLRLARRGSILCINGVDYDFGPLPDGASLPQDAVACEWLSADPCRREGVLHLTLVLPHGADAPEETLFPQAVLVTTDGEIPVPSYDRAAAEELK